MNVTMMTMDRSAARRQFLRYRNALKEARAEQATAEDAAIMEGYRVMSGGKSIINVHQVFQETGVDQHFRPKLAIARADEKRVTFSQHAGHWWFGRDSVRSWYLTQEAERQKRLYFRCPMSDFPTIPREPHRRWEDIRATVPTIPLPLRPTGLERYHILWEAEWESPPRDPLLLRSIGQGLFVVLAQWDLTDLERSILFGRR